MHLQNFAHTPQIGRLENKRTWKTWKVKQYRFKEPRLIMSLSFEKEHSKKASPKCKEDATIKRIIMYQQILSVWRDITKTASQPWNRYLIPQTIFSLNGYKEKWFRCHFLCLTDKNRHLLYISFSVVTNPKEIGLCFFCTSMHTFVTLTWKNFLS